ncbi:MAG: SUMF1/EgtB/PvdO family nonheme iron enzyme [Myxococcota bacterium]
MTLAVVWAPGCSSKSRSAADQAKACADSKLAASLLIGLDERDQKQLLRDASRGLIVARAETEGCNVRFTLLPDCMAPGRYRYRPDAGEATTLIQRARDIPDVLPLAGADVRRAMALFGGLKVQVLRAGRLVASKKTIRRRLLRGAMCGQATHVAQSIALGAYSVAAVERERLPDLGDLFEVDPLGGHKTVLRDGRRSACEASRSRGRTEGCATPVRIQLVPLPEESEPTPTVQIAAGRYVRGFGNDNETAHEVELSPFVIDANEVSVADYLVCAKSGKCTAAGDGRKCNAKILNRGTHPINCVTWRQAARYCRFVGKRLPTKAEWERAALIEQAGPFPWGEMWPPPNGTVNLADRAARRIHPEWASDSGYVDGFVETAPVGAFGGDRKIRNMAGNVMEWTADFYAPYSSRPQLNPRGPSQGTTKVVRGSSFGHGQRKDVMVARRRAYRPDFRSAHIGFRCASDESKR